MTSGPSARESSGHVRHSRKPRRYNRVSMDTRVAVWRAGQARPYHGRSLGISEAGISSLLAVELEIGECVTMEFGLPGNSHVLHLRALVRNRSGARFGIEFLTLSERQRAAITEYCHAQAE